MKTNNKHIDNDFPTLEKLKSQNGFETPDGYFNSLHNSIIDEVKEKTPIRKITIFKSIRYAASFLLIAGALSLFFFNKPTTNENNLFGDLTVSEYMEEFQEIDLELDEALLLDEVALK